MSLLLKIMKLLFRPQARLAGPEVCGMVRSKSCTDDVRGNPILIDDDNDNEVEVGSRGPCRISPRQNKGKRRPEDGIMPWTDTATFYDASDNPELLSDQWEAVQKHWFDVGFLKSIRDMELRKNVLRFEKRLLEPVSNVAEEGELLEGCALDLMSTWVAVGEECLVLLDRAAFKLFRSQARTAGRQLCRSKTQRSQTTKFTRVLKHFLDQEKVVEGIMEFLEDQERGREEDGHHREGGLVMKDMDDVELEI